MQCDEIWSFCYAKDKNLATAIAAPEGSGDGWTWTAIARIATSCLAFDVGNRSATTARDFMCGLTDCRPNRVELTADGYGPDLKAVGDAFAAHIDFAMHAVSSTH